MSQEIDYKNTLNLPVTDFPMKANLAQREPEYVSKWSKENTYEKMTHNGDPKDLFIMPDGPPYANGGIHMGHTLNKCLKDFTIKYQNLKGKKAVFVPGWDCHGLPIEHSVLKKMKKSSEASPEVIRQQCREEAMKWVEHQKSQFQRLGILADWDHPYLTLAPDYEAEEVRELARVLKNGTLYRGLKPVYWCYALQTALAEAEIEYAPHKSPAVYVKFPYQPSEKFGTFDKPVHVIIWTTTPWTLPSNMGIALNKDYDYTFFEADDEYWLIANDMKEAFEADTEKTLKNSGRTFKGADFEYEKTKHCFYDRDSLMILGNHVTTEAGTGCVHTAPGHGQDDFIVGNDYKLDVLSPVNAKGLFTSEVPEYEGEHIFKANPMIVERLQTEGRLVHHKIIDHSYPHCWRSKTPLIFRATSQWFIRMDDKNYNIREKALTAIKEINFVPDWGVKRLTAMIQSRPDWCVSRQRNWGVPIPVFYCQNCEYAHMTEELLLSIADKMENSGGIEAYFEGNTEDLNDLKECPECQSTQWKKGTDILDVWFDSGTCHAAVQRKREGLASPADLYLEGSDQHRGWFQTSLISSIASTGQPPFQTLLTHNFVNDENGRKMSKSLGNYVDPMKLIKEGGAELLRLWTASQDYGQDMNFNKEGFKRISETYRRFRNTFRFLLGNLNDFDYEQDAISYEKLLPLDKWALARLDLLIESSRSSYDNFEFFKVYHELNQFFVVDLSAHYLDILKDRLYTWKSNGADRRSAQTVMYHITETLITLMAPMTSFLSEESYQYFSGKSKDSVFMTDFPKAGLNGRYPEWQNETITSDFNQLFEIREVVTKQLEEMRKNKIIGKSLEAFLSITTSGEEYQLLKKYEAQLCEFFIVSQFKLSEGDKSINCIKANGEKCPRCWYISEDIGNNEEHPLLCTKCVGALT